MTRRWLFIRHGESVANADGWLAGHHDAPLTEVGRRQAAGLATSVAGWTGLLLSSDLRRAVDTATLAFGRSPDRQVPGLRERHLGDWECAAKRDLQADGRWTSLLSWSDGPPRGESQYAVAVRMIAALDALDHDLPDGDVAVVSHGTALRCALGVLDDLPRDHIGTALLPNVGIAERLVPRGGWRLRA